MANTLDVVRYGRYTNNQEADFGIVGPGFLRACVYDELTANTWFTKITILAGKNTGTNCSICMSLWETDGSMNPTTRAGYTETVSVTVSKTDATNGDVYTGDFVVTAGAPTEQAAMGYSGRRYGVAFTNTVGTLCHSMRQGSAIVADNELFYDKSGQSIPPSSSFGAYSSENQGHITFYVTGWENVAPDPPNIVSPIGSITSTAPTFVADFRDKNGDYGADSGLGIDTGDEMTSYRIRVRRKSDGVYFWQQTYTPTSTEINNDQISRAYAGTTLVRGTEYEWRVSAGDSFGEYSDFAPWTSFTPVSQGFVTLDGTPTGKIEVISGITFQGRWNHQAGTTMKTVQIKLLDGNGVTVQNPGTVFNIVDVASSALPGTLFSFTQSEGGLLNLDWGQDYQYQIRGNDGTNWSDWSAPRSFSTNAAPYIPTNLSPKNDIFFTSYPMLSFLMTDEDDTVASGLTATIRITKPDTTTVDVVPTYNVTTGYWEFQTTATQIPAVGAYSWTATGYDGTIYSGEATSLATAVWATPAEFNFTTGPTVTLVQPLNNVPWADPEMEVIWTTSTTQVSYRIRIFADDDAGTLIYDTGEVTSGNQSHFIASGYLENNTAYDLTIEVEDIAALIGYSPLINFTVSFTPANPPSNFSAVAVKLQDDAEETAIRLSWDQTEYSSPEFAEYVLKRVANSGSDNEQIILKRFKSPAQLAYNDYVPASGIEYTYYLSVVIYVGSTKVTSEILSTKESVNFKGVVLSQIGNGAVYRVYLNNVTERTHRRIINEKKHLSLARDRPVTIRGAARYWEIPLSGFLIDTHEATAKEKKDRLEELDEQNALICFRDGRGRKRYCMITNLEIKDEKPDFYSFTMTLTEEWAKEGVS